MTEPNRSLSNWIWRNRHIDEFNKAVLVVRVRAYEEIITDLETEVQTLLEPCDCGEQLADELMKALGAVDALERIQAYAHGTLHAQLEGRMDAGWVWRVAHDALFPCTCNHSTFGGVHDDTCPRNSEDYKVR